MTAPAVDCAIHIKVVMPLPSAANLRESWRVRARRVKAQREGVLLLLRAKRQPVPAREARLRIVLTRCGTNPLDDDNLASAFKAVRDGVADWLGRDDGEQALRWDYAQAPQRREPAYFTVEIFEC